MTNPPYRGVADVDVKLADYIKTNYPDSKNDLFAVFMEVCHKMNVKNGYQAMITQHAWMFLSSFEKLRAKIQKLDIVNMVHLGARAFEEIAGEVVQTTSFILANKHVDGYKGTYCRLVEPTTQQGKEEMFLSQENRYIACSDNFAKIPGAPVAYWLSNRIYDIFNNKDSDMKKYCLGEGKNVTTNNAKYILNIWEVAKYKVGAFNLKWLPCAMGGEYRKWYGNIVNVIDWSIEAQSFYRKNKAGRIIRKEFWNMFGVTWGKISSGRSSFRFLNFNQMYQETAILQKSKRDTLCALAILNSKISSFFLDFLSPTINFQLQDICNIPVLKNAEIDDDIVDLAKKNISLSKSDWDAFETSWDFTKHPLLRNKPTISEANAEWEVECNARFAQLKANEEELNRIFIDIYGLQDELTPEVEDKDVTVRKADLQRDIKSLLSYAVGCMFGRYSLDVEGLAYAGGEWDESKYVTFKPDEDNVIPITDEDYFEDDIIGRLIAWLKVVYGAETLEENLRFIADALGTSGDTARQKIRNYFLKDFFKDHCKIYQKRPIYWLYDSGKQNGFKALIYMHRYNADTSGQVRAEYLGKMEETYESEINRMQDIMDNGAGREVALAGKRKEKLQKQLNECRDYDAVLGHIALASIAIDLDDGVKVNYVKVQTAKDGKLLPILAKI